MASSWPSSTSSKRPRPLRSSRIKVQSYHEDSDSEDISDSHSSGSSAFGRRGSLSLRPRSSHRIPVSYREDSTDGTSDEFMSTEDSSAALFHAAPESPSHNTHPRRARNGQPPPARRTQSMNTRSQSRRSKRPSNKNRVSFGRPLYKRQKVEIVDIPSSGVIPQWQSLPYHILLDIFYYASYPLVNEAAVARTPSVQWLVDMAQVCKSFHEPALAALYYSPPLVPANKAHGLLNLLSKPQEDLSTNYASKIKELQVDVEPLLMYKCGPTLGYFNLSELVRRTPQVKRMRLYHQGDQVVGAPRYEVVQSKWNYPGALFSSIDSDSMQLRSWEWNSRFLHTNALLPQMLYMHAMPAFQSLQELKMMHIGMEDPVRDEDGQPSEQEDRLSMALKKLSQLSQLEFFECPALNHFVLSNLPSTLTRLTIVNCDEVTSEDVGSFLASHGEFLEELCLFHNRYISLSFLAGLAASCKHLRRLKVDTSIRDSSSFHDVEPGFAELLHLSEIPTWPATLQDIELKNLQNWDDAAAGIFFSSLIDAAPELSDLRRLVISAILTIGWRDRASFREKWIGMLETVFLRRSKPPNLNLRRIPRSLPQEEKLTRFGNPLGWELTRCDEPSDDLAILFKRKSARIAQRRHSENEDDDDESPRSNRTANEGRRFVQGMCDVVQVRIDNQRPSETQYNEKDFLDDELSGDEDWNGGRV